MDEKGGSSAPHQLQSEGSAFIRFICVYFWVPFPLNKGICDSKNV